MFKDQLGAMSHPPTTPDLPLNTKLPFLLVLYLYLSISAPSSRKGYKGGLSLKTKNEKTKLQKLQNQRKEKLER